MKPEQVSAQWEFHGVLKTAAERIGGRLLIILDQFEEYFLYHGQEDGAGFCRQSSRKQ